MQRVTDFNTLKNTLLGSLRQMSELLFDLGFLPRLVSAEEKLRQEHMRLLVVGEFSRGKSTFINAILGQPILPTKVNPTTAAINIIQGGEKPRLSIIYHHGLSEDILLPTDQVNRFLDPYVTDINPDIAAIKQLVITWPGRLEQWNCQIVDTPGVNDLDEAREELTFNYLAQADTCVLVLDSQQPLSASEMNFLQHKVMTKDIHRVVFVINRMDEVAKHPDDAANTHLTDYVSRLLRETIAELAAPKVYPLSSKETLRARHSKKPSPWAQSFADFEGELLRTIAANAAGNRLPEHAQRAVTIAFDGLKALEERLQLLAEDDQSSARLFLSLREREERLKGQMAYLMHFMELAIGELSNRITATAHDSFTRLKEQLQEHISQCQDNEGVALLKIKTSQGVHRCLDDIYLVILAFREEISVTLNQHFADLLEEEIHHPWPTAHHLPTSLEDDGLVFDDFPQQKAWGQHLEPVSLKSFTAVGIMGFISGALFGPMGIVATLAGSLLLGKYSQEQKEEWKASRARAIEALREQTEEIINNAQEQSQEIARYEILPFLDKITERINSKLHFTRLTIEMEKNLLGDRVANQRQEKELLEERRAKLVQIMKRLRELQGVLQ